MELGVTGKAVIVQGPQRKQGQQQFMAYGHLQAEDSQIDDKEETDNRG